MIAQTFVEAFAQVKILADRFQKDEKEYLKTTYQEAEVRQHFLDKFFVALGWDVYHQEQSNPYEREVKIEKSVMVGGRGKRADYAFYTAPNFSQARFMAEAKNLRVNSKTRKTVFRRFVTAGTRTRRFRF